MKIGELAQRVGIEPSAIRYYEGVGLLPKADRTASGYRQYTQQAAERLMLIKLAKQFGFSLTQLSDLLAPAVSPHQDPNESELDHEKILTLLAQQAQEIENTVAALEQKRQTLNHLHHVLSATWHSGQCVNMADIQRLLRSKST
ncbi:MerR family transcriptional regulator [Alteromonas oceanisediminis]|uniref:MerR family transcriptional regulator n=1 Tax=Alteromonas oceanisediminis TaxID=2836180 RepID=UPI001BDB071F|nr:MerR family transcriptional regulator [Alteromonas oceanisediminis]MBT0586595.1 MerR family transcriptional regulator [Alteromonas oceanisediminis]